MKRTILLLISIILFLPGCWDRIDIESRAYILGIAIDKYPPIPQEAEQNESQEAFPKEEEKMEKMELHAGEPAYAVTIQIPILKKANVANVGTGGGSGGDSGSLTWEITQVGNSFISMNREILSRTSLTPYYEHLQVIVISQEVAREGLEKVLDFFVRDPEMRRRVRVFISESQAKSILDVKPRVDDFSSMYLAKLPMNSVKTARMIHKTDLGEIINFIHEGYDFALPRVKATKDEIKASGAAVIKKDKMVGWLGELELEALKLIRNQYLGGVIVVKSPEVENGLVTLEVTKANAKITPVVEGEYPRFDINIKVEGNYAEEINMHTHGRLDEKILENLEKVFAKEIERICRETVKKVQQEYDADIFHFSRILKTEKPAYWKQIKDQWNSVFPNVDVKIKAEVNINLTGIAT